MDIVEYTRKSRRLAKANDVAIIELHNTPNQQKKVIKMENDATHLIVGYLWNTIAQNMKYYISHQDEAMNLIEEHRKKLKIGCDKISAECVDAEIENLLTKFHHRVKYNINTLDTYYVDKLDRITRQESFLQMEIETLQRKLKNTTEALEEVSFQKTLCESKLKKEADELKKIPIIDGNHNIITPIEAKKRKSGDINKAIQNCKIEMMSVMDRGEDL